MIDKRRNLLGLISIVLVFTVSFSLVVVEISSTRSIQDNTSERSLSVIEPDTVNYTVLAVRPSLSENTVKIEYRFNQTIDRLEIDLESESPSLGFELIESSGVINDNSSTVRFYNRSTVSLKYTSKIDDNLEKKHRFFSNSISFSSWPEVDGEITVNGTRYSFSYDTEKATKKIRTDGHTGFGDFRDSIIVSNMGNYMIIEDTSSPLINVTREKISTNNANYTVINSKAIKGMRFEKLFSSLDIIFDRTNKTYKNTLFVLPRSPSYYAGGAFEKERTETTLWVDSHFVSEKHYITVAHEIVHASQTYRMDDKTEWWIEGSANYIGGLIKMETFEEIDKDNFIRSAFGDENTQANHPTNVTLSNPDSWTDSFNYFQGARLAYIIDREIRNETNQHKNILDLHHWMQDTNKITHEKFISKLKDWTSGTFVNQVESYMSQSTLIDINFSLDMFKPIS